MTFASQYERRTSRADCATMPVEPDAWYSLTMFYHDDVCPMYERVSWRKGIDIDSLHRTMDMIKNSESVRVFVWIERLNDIEVEEMGL